MYSCPTLFVFSLCKSQNLKSFSFFYFFLTFFLCSCFSSPLPSFSRSFLGGGNFNVGESPTWAILTAGGMGEGFPALWAGLGQALSVVEGVVGGNEPDRFGALLRGYLAYLHLMDESVDHFNSERKC